MRGAFVLLDSAQEKNYFRTHGLNKLLGSLRDSLDSKVMRVLPASVHLNCSAVINHAFTFPRSQTNISQRGPKCGTECELTLWTIHRRHRLPKYWHNVGRRLGINHGAAHSKHGLSRRASFHIKYPKTPR